MTLFVPHTWIYFFICLLAVIIAQQIMARQGKKFFYIDGIKKSFTMRQLEFPKNRLFDFSVFSGINLLPPAEADEVKKNLRGQLWVDYLLFMPAAYTGIFLICMHTAVVSTGDLKTVFVALAWFQAVCWLLDIIENTYFLGQIRNPKQPSAFGFICFRLMELLKWVPSSLGFIASIIVLIIHRL